jgi:hypothetical protein
MEHLSFEIICRIADGDIQQNEMTVHVAHWKSCETCQREVQLQRSIFTLSRQTQLTSPSPDFTQNILDLIIPSRKKRWYEWVLHNMGNIFAMTIVLVFLGYVFSATETETYQKNTSTKIEPILNFFKLIQDGSHQISNYLTFKFSVHSIDASHTHTIVLALLALILLVFIDRIASHFLSRLYA